MSVTGGGTAASKFTLAESSYKQDKPNYIRITCFGTQADLANKYLRKGSKVGIQARVQTGSYKGKDGSTVYTTDFIAHNLEFLDSKPKGDDLPPGTERIASGEADSFDDIEDDGDMPF